MVNEAIDLLRLEPIAPHVRALFLEPSVTDDYRIDTTACDADGVVRYLCGEPTVSEERVRAA